MDSVAFRIPSTVLFREVQGELVMLDVAGEQYYGLDEVGRHIVTAITEQPFDAALAHLELLFDVDPQRLRLDIEHLTAELVSVGLLTPIV